MQVHVGYTAPKRYVLTPSRRNLGKFVARGSRHAIAVQCWKDDRVKCHLLAILSTTLHTEIATLCADKTESVLKDQSLETIANFK